ncbi:MAG: YibE/F family protein [Clostridiales Family XIII bacterium]|jgi:uncharacterized membrane protein|nr:YibE/F family protein [Clostridiales Family XIII bacterium]
MSRIITCILWGCFTAIFVAALVLLNSGLDYPQPADIQKGNAYETARVIRVLTDTRQPDPDFPEIAIGVQELELEVLTGKDRGRRVAMQIAVTRLTHYPAKPGTKLIVSSYDGFLTGAVVGYSRTGTLFALVALFVVSVVVFGGRKGLRALFGLAFTLCCVVFLFIPLLLKGMDPIVAALVCSVLSVSVTLLALNGFCAKTAVAGASCILCTLAAGLIAFGFGALTQVSTLSTPEAEDLIFVAQGTSLHLPNLLFAGILIAATGAMMDTTVSIASSLSELHALDPGITPKQLLKSGLNIGKDVMGTMTNTLILAFAGSSINALLILFMYQMPWQRTLNTSLLVIELLKGMSGSTALVLSVPVTALLGARLIGKKG